jgi:hypothetical protein
MEKRALLLPMIGPVEKLAKLLGNAAQVDEKIHDAMDALMLIKKRVSECLAQRYVAMKDYRFQMPEDLMKEEQSYMASQAFRKSAEIAKQIRPVEEQIIHANVEHLRQTFNQERAEDSTNARGDRRQYLACQPCWTLNDPFSLHSLNEKLCQLGADAIQVRMVCRPRIWEDTSEGADRSNLRIP